jgi:3-oxoacyl-[acyl-carrier-protein] synthase II
MLAGESGVVNIRGRYVPENFPVPYGAVVDPESLDLAPQLPGDTCESMKSWRKTAHAMRRLMSEFEGSPVEASRHAEQVDAIVYGTADGMNFDIASSCYRMSAAEYFPRHQLYSHSSLRIINEVLAEYGWPRVSEENLVSVNAACASGNLAIGIGFNGIRSGRWRRVIVGGVDARCEPSNFMNFYILGALTTADVPPHKASRPFSADRSGFVRGEGAAVLMLEREDDAIKRGAKILGRVLGYGSTSDAYRLTDGREDGSSVRESMRLALESAGLAPSDIDYINAHGTSTPLNDRLEVKAVKSLFGDVSTRIPISSLKSQVGHPTVAASAIEAVACMMMIREQKIAPTLNLDVPDPEFGLDFVPHVSREARLRFVLSNSFGFGGQNACIVFGGME